MPVDIRDHPQAPPAEELQGFTLIPVSREEIASRQADGETLAEADLTAERDDVYVELDPDPTDRGTHDDIGTALYRLVQLFGTPNVPGFDAGGDLSDREHTTFKYLFRLVNDADEGDRTLPDEWLVTAFDKKARLGVGLADWDGEVDPEHVDGAVGLVSLALVTNVVSEPIETSVEDNWY
ncbi:hypothetical protein [Halobaculum marinum]|uniref:Uncharacterized protein n=1 Tax=Halobaculum marinum TaxID=3031996 RepID=A0ABD5WY67_9EURY|nr:hypothetical protein [Halobaculum sp. DT55]